MEEKLAVAELSCYALKVFRFTSSFDLKQSQAFDGLIYCIEAVGANEVTLWLTFSHRGNLNTHAVIDVLNRVHLILTM